MIDPRPGEQHESEQPLSLDKAARLLFLSFKYSQGTPEIQGVIFDYLKSRHPAWTVENSQDLVNASSPIINKFLQVAGGAKHAEVSAQGIINSIETESKNMALRFNTVPLETPSQLAYSLLVKLIGRELNVLAAGGRPLQIKYSNGTTDKMRLFSSQLCKYGFLEKNAGMPEYNEMFRDITEGTKELLSDRSHSQVAKDLQLIIKEHNHFNPSEQVSLPTPDA